MAVRIMLLITVVHVAAKVAAAGGPDRQQHVASLPRPYVTNFPPVGSRAASQLFPCTRSSQGAASKNQTAFFNASTGLLSLAGKCLGVSDNSFGQDGQPVNGNGCPESGEIKTDTHL
eukprot:SAG11_NODE_19057_length_475_cov_0.736702_1_plen_116_part_01